MSERLKPPEGFDSWIEYAIATMDTRSLHLDSIDDSPWGREVSREEMREAALKELFEMKEDSGE